MIEGGIPFAGGMVVGAMIVLLFTLFGAAIDRSKRDRLKAERDSLLEALEQCMADDFGPSGILKATRAKARTAIAKATIPPSASNTE